MPTYEYRCDNDNSFIETRERYEIGPACPLCDMNMKRVWSAPGIQFKGSGFYKTDNR
jgi:putative FmdB family regulatory protein